MAFEDLEDLLQDVTVGDMALPKDGPVKGATKKGPIPPKKQKKQPSTNYDTTK
jgi:hypothetical protein